MSKQEILLIYDKQCPACDNYCRFVRIRDTVGELKLVDAREDTAVLKDITALGLDIDQGMVLVMAGNIYYGADAIHALSLISSRSGVFNRFNFWVFRSKTVSKIMYPILRAFRNVLLKILRKTKINNLGIQGNNRF